MLRAEGPRRDAEAAPFYGMEAIMAGTAYTEGWEDAEASLVAEMRNEELSQFAGSAQFPKAATGRKLDEAELEEQLRGRQPSEEDLEQEQRERRRRNDMLARLRVCPPPRRQHAFEQRSAGAARLASSCLRSRVTIPAHVEEQGDWQATIDSAERLPRVSCAFRNCPWYKMADDEAAGRRPDPEAEAYWDRALQAHILEEHNLQIQQIALVPAELAWDVYKEALSVQERRSVPAVGPAMDRRAFEATQERYKDERMCALICFSCARICLNTGGSRSDSEYVPGMWLARLPAGPSIAQSRGKRRVLRSTVEQHQRTNEVPSLRRMR